MRGIKKIHPCSIESYYEGKMSGYFTDRQKEIMHVLKSGAMTVRQIKNKLGLEDINEVAPRVVELKDEFNILYECDKVRCEKTGKTVQVVAIKPEDYNAPQMDMFR